MSMDGPGNSTSTDLAVVDAESPEAVEPARGPKELSSADLRAYAKATGKTILVLKEMGRRAIMGELVQKLGAAKMGSSMLIDSEEMIKSGIEQCDRMFDDYPHEPEVRAAIMKAKLGFAELWVKAAQSHIKSKRDSGPDESEIKPLATPFPVGTAVQTNVQVNLVGAEKPKS